MLVLIEYISLVAFLRLIFVRLPRSLWLLYTLEVEWSKEKDNYELWAKRDVGDTWYRRDNPPINRVKLMRTYGPYPAARPTGLIGTVCDVWFARVGAVCLLIWIPAKIMRG